MQFQLLRSYSRFSIKSLLIAVLFLVSLFGAAYRASALQAVVRTSLFYAPEKGTGQLKPYIEVYFEIDPQSILFRKTDSVWQASVQVDMTLSSGGAMVNQEHYILETPPLASGAQTLTQRIMDLRRFSVPGSCSISIKFSDQIKKNNEYVFNDSIMIRPPAEGYFFSDVQLLDTAFLYAGSSIYKRNDRLQIPLPANFAEERKNLHFYAELYRQKTDEEPQRLVRKIFISRKEGDAAVNNIIVSDTVPSAQITVTQGTLPIATLASGNYYLNMTVQDTMGQKLAAQSVFFQVMNKKPEKYTPVADTAEKPETVTYLNLAKTFLSKYTPAQIRAILKMLLPVATPSDQQQIEGFLKSTEEMYARYFIYNFWAAKDPADPERAWKEYAERVKAVNKLFGSSMKPGYETDRGIIQLRYGKPTERLMVQNESGARPYEIWQYNTLPGNANAVFLFYRYSMGGNNYELLHSTVPGEIRNRQWRSMLYVNGMSPDPQNSRAESYLNNR